MGTPLRVLIAEDSEDDAALLMRELRRGGYDPTFTRIDTPLGMANALGNEERWDIVFADNSMPHFSATEALKFFKESGLDLPFIIVSGTITDEKAVAAMRAGAHDYIIKGNLSRLVPAVERELREAVVRQTNRQADELLRESEEKYRSLVENIPDVAWRAGREGNTVFIGSNVEKVCGYTPQEIYLDGENLLFGKIHPEDRPRVKDAYRSLFEEHKMFDVEYRIQRKDGQWIWLNDRAVRTFERNGALYADGLFSDITERKRLQNQFFQSQKMEAIGRLTGGVAHDFNNLLTAVKGYSELVLNRSDLNDVVRRHVGEIDKAADRATALTRQLLAYSRKSVAESKILNPNSLIRNLEDMLRRLVPAHIEFATRLESKVDSVKADPALIEQVIVNLVVNARDAMPQGGRLMISTENIELDEGYGHLHGDVRPGPYVKITVSDTGYGMTPEVQSHLFEPFYTTKEKGKGTGLGLSTVYGIVQQNGGHISVYSEVDKGTMMKVFLPRAEEEAAREGKPLEALRPVSRTVLLVEDEEAIRKLVHEFLEKEGYTILEAADGNEALSLSEKHVGLIDLLLTDVVVPGLGGPEISRRVGLRHPGMKVLYMSGYSDSGIIERDILESGLPFLQKPFPLQALSKKMREVLG